MGTSSNQLNMFQRGYQTIIFNEIPHQQVLPQSSQSPVILQSQNIFLYLFNSSPPPFISLSLFLSLCNNVAVNNRNEINQSVLLLMICFGRNSNRVQIPQILCPDNEPQPTKPSHKIYDNILRTRHECPEACVCVVL